MLNWIQKLNDKYDDLEENKRFSTFLLCVVMPISIGMAFNTLVGLSLCAIAYAFRVICPKLYNMKNRNSNAN